MRIESYTVGAFQENAYLVIDEASGRAVLVDPGAEGARLVAAVRRSGALLEAVWVTHAHVDHVGGIAAVVDAWDVPVFLHPLDEPLYRMAELQAAAYGLPFDPPPAPSREFAEGDAVSVGSLRFAVMHAPGHAPGHVVLHGHGVALVGDCLFAGSVGRTDLPYSKPADLAASLQRITTELAPETVVYPGHGPRTTLAAELRANPFLNGTARLVGA